MNFPKPTLNIGVVGSGFMGKTHVYGYAIADRVFDLPYKLNLISILPLNFGYSQMVYGISFKYFSLPGELAFAIATIRQIAQVFVILLALLIFTKKSKLNTNNQK